MTRAPSADRRRPAHHRSVRDDVLRSWLGETVRPYSAPLGSMLEQHGLRRRGAADSALLMRLPVTPIAELGDGLAYVLEPTVQEFGRAASIPLQTQFLLADVRGRRDDFARRHVDPIHKPVVWCTVPTVDGALFVANTTTDLDRLADLGLRALAIVGVRDDDRVVLVGDGTDRIADWQLVLGCRRGGVALMRTSVVADDALGGSPTVVAGSAAAIGDVVEQGLPSSVRLVLVERGSGPAPSARPQADVEVVEWWTAPGARAAWARCPGGTGFHTWPDTELIEAVDGRLVWSAVGWYGSVWLRVDTGARASIERDECPTCGRTTPRVLPGDAG